MFTPFDDSTSDPPVHGFLHQPAASNGDAIVLTHGAGANCQSKFLYAMAEALSFAGFTVLRFDLPFRQARPTGPPRPGSAARDQQGIRRAAFLRSKVSGRLFLAGHSYGGRQSSILLAEDPAVADGLLLLSYPLHPPKKPGQLRTQHFPKLIKTAFFVHGTRDPFATIPELQSALALIPAPHALLQIENATHDLLPKKSASDTPARIAQAFQAFLQ